jgi:hypothetical protein
MAAGLGFKDFTTGEVLTAADVDGYLMQGIWVFASAAARDAAVTSPQEGNACYLKDTNQVLTYSGSAWVAVGGGSPLTTKGDIYGFSTVDARIPIGANDTVLTADSTQSLGLKWSAPSPSTTNYTLLNAGGTSLSGSTTTVSFTAQNNLFISIESASTDTTDAFCFLRFNGNTGNDYEQVNYNITGALTTLENGSGLNASFRVFRLATTGYQTGFSYIHVFGAKSTSNKVFNFVGAGEPSGTGRSYVGMGRYIEAAAITSVSVINSSGTWDNGTIKIYGAN